MGFSNLRGNSSGSNSLLSQIHRMRSLNYIEWLINYVSSSKTETPLLRRNFRYQDKNPSFKKRTDRRFHTQFTPNKSNDDLATFCSAALNKMTQINTYCDSCWLSTVLYSAIQKKPHRSTWFAFGFIALISTWHRNNIVDWLRCYWDNYSNVSTMSNSRWMCGNMNEIKRCYFVASQHLVVDRSY